MVIVVNCFFYLNVLFKEVDVMPRQEIYLNTPTLRIVNELKAEGHKISTLVSHLLTDFYNQTHIDKLRAQLNAHNKLVAKHKSKLTRPQLEFIRHKLKSRGKTVDHHFCYIQRFKSPISFPVFKSLMEVIKNDSTSN